MKLETGNLFCDIRISAVWNLCLGELGFICLPTDAVRRTCLTPPAERFAWHQVSNDKIFAFPPADKILFFFVSFVFFVGKVVNEYDKNWDKWVKLPIKRKAGA